MFPQLIPVIGDLVCFWLIPVIREPCVLLADKRTVCNVATQVNSSVRVCPQQYDLFTNGQLLCGSQRLININPLSTHDALTL